METLRQLQRLEPYAGFLQCARSPWTRQAYTQALRTYKSFLDERGLSPFEVDRRRVLEFVEILKAPGLTPTGAPRVAYSGSSLIHTLAAVRRFYQYLVAIEAMDKNPTAIVSFLKLKKPERLPRPLPIPDRIALVNGLRWERPWEIKRSLAALLGFHCGLRRSELAALEVNRLDLYGMKVSVIGKGDKERELPLTPELGQALRLHLRVRKRSECPFVFPPAGGHGGVHVKPQIINGWLKEVADWAGLAPFTVHVLRHTFGTQLAETGASVYVIRDLMGHATIMQSETYVKLAASAGRLAHARAFNSGKEAYGQGRSTSQAGQIEGEMPPPWGPFGFPGSGDGNTARWSGDPLRGRDGAVVLPGLSKVG